MLSVVCVVIGETRSSIYIEVKLLTHVPRLAGVWLASSHISIDLAILSCLCTNTPSIQIRFHSLGFMAGTKHHNADAATAIVSDPPRVVIEAVAGFTAGLLNTLVVHPLDVIKTRLQGIDCLPCCQPVGLRD